MRRQIPGSKKKSTPQKTRFGSAKKKPVVDPGLASLAADRLKRAAMEASLTHAPPKSAYEALKAAESSKALPRPDQVLADKLVKELEPSRLEPHFAVRKSEKISRDKKMRSPWKSMRRSNKQAQSVVPTLRDAPLNPAFTKEVLLEKYARLKEEKGFDLVEKLKDGNFCDGFVRKLEPDKRIETLLQSDRYKVMAQIGRDVLDDAEDAERFAHCFLPTDMVREGSIHVHSSLDTASSATSLFGVLSGLQSDYSLDISASGLQANGLMAWADSLEQWAAPTLTSLNLSGNKLGGEEGARVYVVLQSMPNLTALDLSHNPISIEQYEPNSGAARYVSAFHETREEDASKWEKGWLANNSMLTKLNLCKCGMGAEGVRELALQLRKNTALKELDLCTNGMGEMGLPEGWRLTKFVKHKYRHDDGVRRQDTLPQGAKLSGCTAVGDLLTDNKTLTSINISSNDICLVGQDGLEAVCKGLAANKQLTHVDISNNRLMEIGASLLGQALQNNSTLSTVVVSKVGLNIQDMKTKEVVYLYRDQSKEYLDAIVVRAMMAVNDGMKNITFGHELGGQITMSTELEDADFGDRRLAPAAAIILAAFMPKARRLRSLVFCGAGEEIFTLHSRMTELDVSGKLFMPAASLIASFMPKMWALKKLTFGATDQACCMKTGMVEALFGGKNMQSVGAIVLASFLPRCPDIIDLDLSDNCFYAEGTDRVAAALHHNSSVTRLDLSKNSMANEGAGHVAHCIGVNKSLTKIDLSTNSMDDIGANRLVEAMKENKTVKALDVRWNALTDEGKDDLRRVAMVHKVNVRY
jgi:Ran GTPase-activating protein (RanGAP) involved in mRNA processing and transport